MKITKSLSQKMKTAITGLTFITITALFFASCKKDVLQHPNTYQSATVNAKQINHESQEMVFAEIKIDHLSMGAALPDYSVSVDAHGNATFEGRKNVFKLTSLEFKISNTALLEINKLCVAANLVPIKDKGTEEVIFNFPHVTTTYFPVGDAPPIILTDYNTGSPANLVIFRAGVERALGVSKFIKGVIGFPDDGNIE